MAIAKLSGTPKEEKLYTQAHSDKLKEEIEWLKLELKDSDEVSDNLLLEIEKRDKSLRLKNKIIAILGGVSGYYAILHHFY